MGKNSSVCVGQPLLLYICVWGGEGSVYEYVGVGVTVWCGSDCVGVCGCDCVGEEGSGWVGLP